ncbi:MAG: tRNA pseudouridine(38-40) synthase TruA [Actinomycetota bacterium]|jgi:tRNA pseudouridine38-40 synthase
MDDTDAPSQGTVRARVAYHGAEFHGFAANDGVVTVEGTLSDALRRVTGTSLRISAAGRTDAGVHASGQVVSFDLPLGTDLEALARSLNALCAPSVAVRSMEWAEPGFDARSSATWRRYRYTVLNSAVHDPLLVDRAWHIRAPLSIPLMNLACDPVLGEQDFASFCRRPPVAEGGREPSLHRWVFEAGWREEGAGILVFEIRANAFCHQMVRSLTGFLVDVGATRRPASDMRAVLAGRDRNHGSRVAPPHGLVLVDVGYDGRRVHP